MACSCSFGKVDGAFYLSRGYPFPEITLDAVEGLPGYLLGFAGIVDPAGSDTRARMFLQIPVNFGRDLPEPASVADLRNVVAGDPSPDGKGTLELCRGIEVGHIFQLRKKYAEALKCSFLDVNGQSQIMEMGCYGIGVSRIVGAAIEQNHDERGIVFPRAIAPFEVCIVPMGYTKSEAVKAAADALYADLKASGIDVLLDDRNERPGVMFADMELIGIPHRVVVGERGLGEGKFEYKGRTDSEAEMVPLDAIGSFLKARLCNV